MTSTEGPVDNAGGRPRRSARLQERPLFAIALVAITVTLAGIVLAVSILVFLESREPVRTAFDDTPRGDPFRGARVFVNAGCADCHTLATAGAAGTRGPNLDQHFASHTHSYGYVVAKITNGGIGMPTFRNRLSQRQIRDVATFLDDVAGRTPTAP